MRVCLYAEIDGLDLNTTTEDGTVRTVKDTPGWEEGGSTSGSPAERPERHGSFETPVFMSGLEPVIEGSVRAATHEVSVREERRFGLLLAGGAYGTLALRHEDTELLTSRVRRAGRIAIKRLSPTNFEYRLALFAPDPYRYGLEQSASTGFAMPPEGGGLVFPEVDGFVDFGPPVAPATVVLDNPGSADAWPRFAVAGAVNGFRVLDVTAGVPVDYVGAQPEGQSVSIAMKTGRATRDDGEDVTTSLRLPSLLSIPAYSQREYLFEPLTSVSAAVLTASVHPTYH